MAEDRYRMRIKVEKDDPANEETAADVPASKGQFTDLTPRSAFADAEKKKFFTETHPLYSLARSKSPRTDFNTFIDKLVNSCKLIEQLQRQLIYPSNYIAQEDYAALSTLQENFSLQDIKTLLGGDGLPKLPAEHRQLVEKCLPILTRESLEKFKNELAFMLKPKSAATLAPA